MLVEEAHPVNRHVYGVGNDRLEVHGWEILGEERDYFQVTDRCIPVGRVVTHTARDILTETCM